jgi:hypothetical protein
MIKLGDTVERKCGSKYQGRLQNEVTSISDCGNFLRVNGNLKGTGIDQFKVVRKSKRHKHHDEIIAWAKGAEIEFELETPKGKRWASVTQPNWFKEYKYRVKPTEPTELEKLIKEHRAMGNSIRKLEEQANGY